MQEKQEKPEPSPKTQILGIKSDFTLGHKNQGKFPDSGGGSRLPSHFPGFFFFSFQAGILQGDSKIPLENEREMEQRGRNTNIPGKFGGFGIGFSSSITFFPALPLEGKQQNPNLIPGAAGGVGFLDLAQ